MGHATRAAKCKNSILYIISDSIGIEENSVSSGHSSDPESSWIDFYDLYY